MDVLDIAHGSGYDETNNRTAAEGNADCTIRDERLSLFREWRAFLLVLAASGVKHERTSYDCRTNT